MKPLDFSEPETRSGDALPIRRKDCGLMLMILTSQRAACAHDGSLSLRKISRLMLVTLAFPIFVPLGVYLERDSGFDALVCPRRRSRHMLMMLGLLAVPMVIIKRNSG